MRNAIENNRRYRRRLKGEVIPLLTKPYSDSEKEIIIKAYQTPSVNLKHLSLLLNRPKWNISRFARGLGLTDRNHGKPALRKVTQITMSEFSQVGVWKRHSHPKGFLGGTHSAETRATLSAISKKAWADPESGLNSEKRKQALSDRMKIWRASHPITNPYSRAARGRREDLDNRYFKSMWEANFARYLNWLKSTGNIHAWEYESERFDFDQIKRGTRSFLPDFKVWDSHGAVPYFYEVKGWMDEKSKIRLKRMEQYYPSIKVIVIGPKEYGEIKKTISPMIPLWETR